MTQSENPIPRPSQEPKFEQPFFGFNGGTERLNGRLAMIAFIAVVLIELFTGQTIIAWLGWG